MSVAYCLLVGAAQTARGQGAMDAWAQWVLAPKVWKGQMVWQPDAAARPLQQQRLDSWRLPLHVHAPAGASPARMQAALSALENAYDLAMAGGWPLPYADGGAGGTTGFDLYLEPGARASACAEMDGPVGWTDFDAAQTYAVVDAGLPVSDLPACALSALVQAALRGQDPSEAESLVRATGDFAAWTLLGELGCAGAFVDAQRAPQAAMLDSTPESRTFGAAGRRDRRVHARAVGTHAPAQQGSGARGRAALVAGSLGGARRCTRSCESNAA
jgi:hypothetical protein